MSKSGISTEWAANAALAGDDSLVTHTTPEQQQREALALAETYKADKAIRSDRMRAFLFA